MTIFKVTTEKNKKKINTVHNIITFYIVFTNKNVFFSFFFELI